jgi:DNA-binding response OmpR family regulator
MAKILVVDDDIELAEGLVEWLSDDEHVVDTAPTGEEGLALMDRFPYDIIVLDWTMPGMAGLEVCQRYRNMGGIAPIIMLTARGEIKDKESALDSGADDYLVKPFQPRELSARIRAILRSPRSVQSDVIQIGNLSMDMNGFTVVRAGHEVKLSKKEFALLEQFMRHPGHVFSIDALIDKIWASEKEATPDTVRVHMTRLRGKIEIEGLPVLIKTVHGVGYKLEPQSVA